MTMSLDYDPALAVVEAQMPEQTNWETFQPNVEVENQPSVLQCSEFPFTSMLSSPCSFEPQTFSEVMLNMIKNPNVTSSHLFRADIFYDSVNDVSFNPENSTFDLCGFAKHMQPDYRPRRIHVENFKLQRTIVRRLIPRNPKLDRPLVQTCHFLHSESGSADETLVIYLPHVSCADSMPWYHPAVESVGFLHTLLHRPPLTVEQSIVTTLPASSYISLHVALFSETNDIPARLGRTSLKLLRTVHKHGQGLQAGYVKRVSHDVIIPQKRFQDTYTRLKNRYAVDLIGDWREQTDPTKHVFEDLGIVAFLIELWTDMYGLNKGETKENDDAEILAAGKRRYPGFVDIGCGNGVLVYLLLKEGYHGYGFDARKRKSWDSFPAWVQDHLKERILIPGILDASHGENAFLTSDLSLSQDAPKLGGTSASMERLRISISTSIGISHPITTAKGDLPQFTRHNDLFPAGTFIISNHADELTCWTPLLAYLSSSPFICIPCCSHDLSGARFRAPVVRACSSSSPVLESQAEAVSDIKPESDGHTVSTSDVRTSAAQSTVKKKPSAKPQSAYASLCAYVTRLAEELGFQPESEMLRIPSTRNAAIIGRSSCSAEQPNLEATMAAPVTQKVYNILKRELGRSVEEIGIEWYAHARKIAGTKGSSH